MGHSTKTQPKVFIIESLRFEDESNDFYEGQVISRILNFGDIKHQYFYIRTKAEFEHLIEKFIKSNYRYLHISCHGNPTNLATTLDNIPFQDLSFILQNALDKRRLFISACSAVNQKLASALFGITDCYSIIGPDKKINMDDAAIFWASFYHLMFKQNRTAMKRDILEPTLKKLVALHQILLKYFSSSAKSKNGWKEVTLK